MREWAPDACFTPEQRKMLEKQEQMDRPFSVVEPKHSTKAPGAEKAILP
jgi:hypothetical protein